MSERDLFAMVEDVVRGRRLRRRRLDAGEARLAATAASLRAGRPEVAAPDPGFVDDLARRLRQAEAEQAGLSPAGRRRRQFLAASGVAAAAAVAGIAGDRLVERLRDTTPPGTPNLVPASGVWHAVARLADIAGGGSVAFTARGVSGVIAHQGEDVIAVSAVCTHQGCLLALDRARSLLRCPCHPVNFDLGGNQVAGSYPLPSLPRLSARVNGDQVEVLLPA